MDHDGSSMGAIMRIPLISGTGRVSTTPWGVGGLTTSRPTISHQHHITTGEGERHTDQSKQTKDRSENLAPVQDSY